MCKGISIIATPDNLYWATDNSHETIKKENNLRDKNGLLLIAELYPRGQKFYSDKLEDWEFNFENCPSWADVNDQKERIFNFLVGELFPKFRRKEMLVLRLDGLNYKILPIELPVVQKLHCSNNQLTALPELPVVQKLCCYNNQLTALPELPVVQKLYCYNNQLTALPELPVVQELCCSKNILK
jgi:hypothetical protein